MPAMPTEREIDNAMAGPHSTEAAIEADIPTQTVPTPPSPIPAPKTAIVEAGAPRIADVIEWKGGRGALGHVVSIEPDGLICVQQPAPTGALVWFKAFNGQFAVIGRAVGRYKIPPAEIAAQSERLKPKPANQDSFEMPG